MELFGILLGPLGFPLAPFGCFWRPLGLTLAPHGPHFGPSRRHPQPFQRHGLILEVFSFTLDRFWAPFWHSLLLLSPWDSLWPSKFQINRLVSARLSPDECWRVPAKSTRILRNRLVTIEGHRHLIFLKVSNCRLPHQAESKKQGGGGASPAGRLQLIKMCGSRGTK